MARRGRDPRPRSTNARDAGRVADQVDEVYTDKISKHRWKLYKTVLGKSGTVYKLHSPALGRGSYGVVRACYDVLQRTWTAVKEVPKGHKDSKEVGTLERLQDHGTCRYIIKYIKCLEFPSSMFYMFELAGGNDLHKYMGCYESKKTHMPETFVHTIIRSASSGLCYLHEQGLVHGDIKPDNFAFTESGILKIIDFGLSEWFDPGERLKVVQYYRGTTPYIAPEHLIYDKKYGGHIVHRNLDVWALGVVLWQIYTRLDSTPFGQPVQQLERNHEGVNRLVLDLGMSPEFKKRCKVLYDDDERVWRKFKGPDEAKALCKKMVHPDMNRRYTSEMVHKDHWLQENRTRA